MSDLAARYNPRDVEDKWYKYWEKQNYFSAKPAPLKKPFSIVIPPPNVTGILHMGHALNNTIQDILIRYQRMNGRETLWMPGTDHAGIATQNVVEKSIAKDGLKRQDLGREKFIERVWKWREEYGLTIISQLKKLGASCDWSRTRFTMDEEYSKAVMEAFVRLFNDGLIYQGDYIINWCPRCLTALSDEEAPHRKLQGNLYYLRYPIKDSPDKYVTVATTRPETMLGDTAVAVNPKDKRFKALVGKKLVLPLVNREITVIADRLVDMKFGTGAVKVTPAHDPNDYLLGKKHKLEFLNVMHPDARMNENAGDYSGMDRLEAREVILEDLKERDLLDKTEPHQFSAGHCYRCHTIIEPYLSRQWFVKMKPLVKPAIEAVKRGLIKFYPKRWTKVYLNWMENIQDWCISRQIWWGHRIPIWYCLDCKGAAIASVERPTVCGKCKSSNLKQDEDVLDTWFSSWLWPFATFYWPQKNADLKYFYPTSVLVTAPEIIFFWVARMIMSGLKFMKKIPFKDIYIHGTVRDSKGKKMSKSLGNIIDPVEIINEYGTDALRFSLISITAQGQDVFLSKERFEQGRNFANKIWNASRFILMNLEAKHTQSDLCQTFKKEDLSAVNRWILSRFYSVLDGVNKNIGCYKFNEAANLLYGFFWHEFCDWYLELIKSDIKDPHNQLVMYKVLEKFLRALHPFMPFITEELWQKISPRAAAIMISAWPHLQKNIIDKKAEWRMKNLFSAVNALRNMRSELEIPAQEKIAAKIFTEKKETLEFLKSFQIQISNLCGLSDLTIQRDYAPSRGEYATVAADLHLVIPVSGTQDIDGQRKRVETRLQKGREQLRAKEKTFLNKDFIKRAPPEIVKSEREKLKTIKETLKKLEAVKNALR
ncbi:valine--tRNA ligase [Candidatus Omnitrophota bacterium]